MYSLLLTLSTFFLEVEGYDLMEARPLVVIDSCSHGPRDPTTCLGPSIHHPTGVRSTSHTYILRGGPPPGRDTVEQDFVQMQPVILAGFLSVGTREIGPISKVRSVRSVRSVEFDGVIVCFCGYFCCWGVP